MVENSGMGFPFGEVTERMVKKNKFMKSTRTENLIKLFIDKKN